MERPTTKVVTFKRLKTQMVMLLEEKEELQGRNRVDIEEIWVAIGEIGASTGATGGATGRINHLKRI